MDQRHLARAAPHQSINPSADMSEIRQDPTTGALVIIAPGRAGRPGARLSSAAARRHLPRYDERCPFCPGNEAQLPGIIAETPTKEPPGWLSRVVPNKYPALAADAVAPSEQDAAHTTIAGRGFHEVIIESPYHDADLASMEITQISEVVATYHRRFVALSQHAGVEAVVLFRNHGSRSGASLVHPHAQAIALPLVPPRLQAMSDWADRQGAQTGCCPTCAELAREIEAAERVVEESSHFVALVPFAAEVPCEQWLVPRRHHASFADTRADELADLAVLLRGALQRLKTAHDDPPYSFAIESAGSSRHAGPYLHWRLRIVPDLVNWGGFERGAGMPINPSAPEADAAALRASLGEGSEAKT
jgi:UDPglucose--hexose-1-phosphate uridylyltransferase